MSKLFKRAELSESDFSDSDDSESSSDGAALQLDIPDAHLGEQSTLNLFSVSPSPLVWLLLSAVFVFLSSVR
jgi:hypothetical protein